MKKILSVFVSIAFMGLSHQSVQATVVAHFVTDPKSYEHLLRQADTLDKMSEHSLHMRDKMYQLSNGIGNTLGAIKDLIGMGLLVAGKCGDPFKDLANQFLGLGKFGGIDFNFCDLVKNRAAFDSLLFIPYNQTTRPEHQQVQALDRQRQQMIRESVNNTLSVTSMQKQEVIERREIINERMKVAMEHDDLKNGMRNSLILLSIIAQELTNIRILLIQQNEVQASTAATQVRDVF